MVLPLLACAQTASIPVEVGRLRAAAQPINAPIPLTYGPHPAWATHQTIHVETDIDSETQSIGANTHGVLDTEIAGTNTVSLESGGLRDEGTIDTASHNGQTYTCPAGALLRFDATYTSQGAAIANSARSNCHEADQLLKTLNVGLHGVAFQVQPTNWILPVDGVASGTTIHKAAGKNVGFDPGDLGARILGRTSWHDQPVIVADLIGCATMNVPVINDKLTLSPFRLCPNGVVLFSTTSGWPLGAYQWFNLTIDGKIGDIPITVDVKSDIRAEMQ